MRRTLAALLVLAAGTACGSESETAPAPAPRTLPAAALPELASRARTLHPAAVAADALQPASVERLLDEAGYVTGREREFSGRTKIFDHVVARTLVFETPLGAGTYVAWLQGHGDDVLGRAERAKLAAPGDDAAVFTLAPCGTCKKELPTFFAGWRRGETVLTLLAAGSGANPKRFSALARRLDEAA